MKSKENNRQLMDIFAIISLIVTVIVLIFMVFLLLEVKDLKRPKTIIFDEKKSSTEFTYNKYENDLVILNINKYVEYAFNNAKIDTELFELEFYKERIPERFYDSFVHFTQNNKELRLQFYSIMVHESGNFRYFVNKNPNGTTDLGPSQLNSANINNKYFMSKYSPEESIHTQDTYCYYMGITFNFFKDLVDKYTLDYAYYAYNGGPKAALIIKNNKITKYNQSLVNNVRAYNKAVNRNVTRFREELDSYIAIRTLQIRTLAAEKAYIELQLRNNKESIKVTLNEALQFDNNILIYVRKDEAFDLLKEEGIVIAYNPIIGNLYVYSTNFDVAV